MSSESENEDFLSADEGSDEEIETDNSCKEKVKCCSPESDTDVKLKDQKENVSEIEIQTETKSEVKHEEEMGKNIPDKKECSTEDVSSLCEQIEKSILKESNVSSISEVESAKGKDESLVTDKERCQQDIPKQIIDSKGDVKSGDKPRKEAKLGMKKPREKLGERLGNKKLGSRITKPLVGISSDSLQNQKSSREETPKSELKSSCEDFVKNDRDESKTNNDTSESSWGSWGDWGMSLASSLSKEVTRGVETVFETVESSIGAPNPETLAKELVEMEKLALEEQNVEEQTESVQTVDEATYSFGFGALGSLVSGVSGALETASNTVLLGGLDTLEKIGRKTMDIIQDGDPGLRKKRAFLTSNKQNLSIVLREARERAIEEEESRRSSFRASDSEEKKGFSISIALLWDNTEGPAHAEALSLVAKQCQDTTTVLLNEISSVWLSKLQEKIAKMKVCSCISEDDKVDIQSSTLMDLTRDFPLPLQFNKVIMGWPALQQSLSRLSIEICGLGNTDLVDIQKELYKEVTLYLANVIGVLHKASEVSLITSEFDRLELTQQFQRLCSCISGGLEKCADDICESISKSISAFDPDFNETITNIYLQMAEANMYMETALSDMITVVVYSEVKSHHDHL
ncbi:hypothetical protein Avbf_00321 [Armadillidium vulgare]|nr:hypothetical protein Avbf_00321 [Armadillidium vulgare]